MHRADEYHQQRFALGHCSDDEITREMFTVIRIAIVNDLFDYYVFVLAILVQDFLKFQENHPTNVNKYPLRECVNY